MSIINELYDNYCESAETSHAKATAMLALERLLSKEDFAHMECALNTAEDAECSAAFAAGFKSAMRFMQEVRA